MRNILLINPWIYDFAAYDFWNKPIGLLFLGSFLRANGANVYFLDCLDPYHPDMCYKNLCGIPKRRKSGEGGYALVHRTFPGIPVILGGNYVTLYPHHAKKSGADFLLAGPAELSIPVLFKNLYNQDMRFIPDIDSLDSYPYPAFELISHPDHVPIMTSRGCPYHCSYCVSHILNSRFRRRDPIRVADEIHYWHTHLGIRHFSFYDDALLVTPNEMVTPLLNEIIRRDLPIHFHCPNGLHLLEITPEISTLMLKAGFKTIRFGFETSDPLHQSITGGKVNNEELEEAVKYLRHAGYRNGDIGIYILCGLPGQSADEVIESICFVQSCGARPIIAEYSPIQGTVLWNDAVASSPYPIAE